MNRGFTLVELVIVIAITSLLAAVVALYVRPAFDAYAISRSRSELATAGAVSLQRMAGDVAMAVPNSIRTPGPQCLDVAPSSASGRVRMGPDVGNSGSAPLDTTQPTAQLDVLTPLDPQAAAGAWFVLGNQTSSDLHGGVTRVAISSAAVPPSAAFGTTRLNFGPAFQFPQGFAGGRFQIVPAAQGVVSYVCTGLGVAQNRGTGTLWRISGQPFGSMPSNCPVVSDATPGAQRLLTGLSQCSFSYDPGPSPSVQYGLLSLSLSFTSGGETATLVDSLQVLNTP